MKKILFLIILVSFSLQGCSGHWANIDRHNIVLHGVDEIKFHKDYEIGAVKTAYIGQPIFRVKAYKQARIIQEVVSPQDLVVNSTYRLKTFNVSTKANSRIKIINTVIFDNSSWETNTGNIYYLVPLKGSDGDDWALLMSEDGSFFPLGMYSYDYNMMYCSGSNTFNPSDFRFKVIRTKIDTDPIQSFELLFSGKNDVSLNTMYREYTGDDLARPAFFQNVTYQKNAKQIRFKNFLIKVHEVSNEKITYSIIEDGLK